MGDGTLAHVPESFVDGQFFLDANAKCFVEFAARLQDIGDSAFGEGAPSAVVQVREHSLGALIGGFRRLYFAQGLLQIAQLERQIDIDRAPLGTSRKMLLEFRDSLR